MYGLFKQINTNAIRQDDLASLVLQNTNELFEGFSTNSLNLLTESAVQFLDATIKHLEQKTLNKTDDVVDLITGLRILGSAAQRDAFHIKLPTVKVLADGAGQEQNVNNTLTKLARNPQQKKLRDSIHQVINSAATGDNKALQKAVQMLQTMKSAYERVQQKLSDTSKSDQPKPSPVPNKANV